MLYEILSSLISKKQSLLFLLCFTLINTYLIFPLEYLPEERYKFITDNKSKNKTDADMMQRFYYRFLSTSIEVGTPPRNFTFVLDSDDDRYYIASNQRPKISNEPEREPKYFNFDKSELLNESYSSTYNKGGCEAVDYNTYLYAELCLAKDIVVFNKSNEIIQKNFQFRMVRNNEDNIPGFLGLLYNYKDTHTRHPNFINDLRGQNLIENNYWFFKFDKISPFDRILQGQLIVGGLPHEIFPELYKKDDYVGFKKTRRSHFHGAWKLEFDKIYVDDKDYAYLLYNTICTINYEMYNIIGSLEFHFRMKENFLEELLEEKKCFSGKFSQNIHHRGDLTFYYCKKEMKDFLYKNLPNIKFYSEDFGQEFELTKEELFYEKGEYIYFMILFAGIEYNYFALGQMFAAKYNFVFNTFYKEVGFYRSNHNQLGNQKKVLLNDTSIYGMGIILICFVSLLIGFMIGKKIFGKKEKKNLATELIDDGKINSNKV